MRRPLDQSAAHAVFWSDEPEQRPARAAMVRPVLSCSRVVEVFPYAKFA